jgi:hypothetical protein
MWASTSPIVDPLQASTFSSVGTTGIKAFDRRVRRVTLPAPSIVSMGCVSSNCSSAPRNRKLAELVSICSTEVTCDAIQKKTAMPSAPAMMTNLRNCLMLIHLHQGQLMGDQEMRRSTASPRLRNESSIRSCRLSAVTGRLAS